MPRLSLRETPPSATDLRNDIFDVPPGQLVGQTNRPQLLDRTWQSSYIGEGHRRLDSFERLRTRYLRDGLVLFLGAGVPAGSGLPSWTGLIQQLLENCAPGIFNELGQPDLSARLAAEAHLSVLAQFDLVRYHLRSDDLFVKALTNALYGSAKFADVRKLLDKIPLSNEKKIASPMHPLWNQIADALAQNKTLAAIGDLLLDEATEQLARNDKVHAVLTTNVDNLLQLYTMSRARGKRRLNSMDRPSVGEHPELTSVFHLHGFLDARGERNRLGAGPATVFCESEYFDTMANTTGFANYTAHSFLQRYNVLFIGTSLDDVNIRRWLYNSYRERVRSRANYLRQIYADDYLDAEIEAEYASVRHCWLRSDTDLRTFATGKQSVLKTFLEESVRHLGIYIVWCKDHDDIASHISAIKV